MFICFVCDNHFGDSKSLCDHIKLLHSTNEYLCSQLNCHRKFSSIRSFMKHLKTHEHDEFLPNIESVCNVPKNCSENVCNNNDEEMLINDDPTIFENTLDNEIFEVANSFVFSLYAKNSLDRLTAENITKDVADVLSKILTNLKEKVAKHIKIKNQSFVNNLFSNATRIFNDINSQKKVIKKLTNLNCYRPVQKIPVQDSVADTFESRNMTLGALSYGCIL